MNGDADHGLVGFNDVTNNIEVVLPLDGGTSTGKSWTLKTADEILADLSAIENAPAAATFEVEQPDTLLLPTESMQLIAKKRIPDTDKTVLEFFRETAMYIKNIISVPKLKGAGVGGTNRMFAYKKDPEYIEWKMPVVRESFAPQVKGLETEVIMHARVASIVERYPLARAYADGL